MADTVPLRYRIIAYLKKLMDRDSTNLIQHVYFKIKLGEWWKLYSRIANKIEGGTTYLCPYQGTGDVYIASSILAARIGPDRARESTVCVIGNSTAKVVRLFGFEKVEVLSQLEMNQLMRLGDIAGYDALGLFVLHPDPPNSIAGISDRMRNYNGLNFLDIYRAGVFGNQYLKVAEPEFDDASDKTAAFFGENGLIPGKTVVIAPYVKTLSMLPIWFWIELVDDLRRKGYTVCTNCGHDEEAIYGTLKICPEYADMKDFMEYAGYFISSRSGLCDVVSTFDMCKVIIYQPNEFWGAGTNRDFFSLNGMGLCSDAIEFEYEGIEFLKLKDRVMMEIHEWEIAHRKEEKEDSS